MILLNNGADNPPDPTLLAQYPPQLNLQVLHADQNLGFTGGNNLAARHAVGEYLVLLNGDAFPPEPDWLEKKFIRLPRIIPITVLLPVLSKPTSLNCWTVSGMFIMPVVLPGERITTDRYRSA